MKTLASLTTALAATVLAAQDDILPNKRDVQTISNAIMQTSTALQQLDTSVKAFTGQDFSQLAADATNVKSALTAGAQQIQGTSNITAQDAITLQGSLAPVQQVGASLITDLTAKKPQIQQASLCQVVQQQVGDIGNAAQTLIQATVSKVPEQLQTVASQLTAQFTGQLKDASLSFSTANCTNAAGGSAAGIAFSNSSTSTSAQGSTVGKSAAPIHAVSAFGLILAGAVSFVLL